MLRKIDDDLLEMAGLIVHQENCVRARPAGLAKAIYDRFPDYDWDSMQRVPGTFARVGHVLTIFGQDKIGRTESPAARERWFAAALDALTEAVRTDETYANLPISFPHGIGCGLAGGNWEHYLAMIEKFERDSGATVYIVRLPTAGN